MTLVHMRRFSGDHSLYACGWLLLAVTYQISDHLTGRMESNGD
jgi:hypothetical protein